MNDEPACTPWPLQLAIINERGRKWTGEQKKTSSVVMSDGQMLLPLPVGFAAGALDSGAAAPPRCVFCADAHHSEPPKSLR